ncbi:unnamed protein product [Medioppia subpectinata]|uniref:Carboxylic ester hydrolase n=1 Tax=Medioppia subpectinata TaxID=1979941 RepID=A0A7R9KEE5_9ACAR|nr:unnamed protein product [Medioppia subpectinata]CAG2101791.1 unnamed protein product [Medioppia subpectinata]
MILCCVCHSNSIDVNTSSGSVRGQTLHVLNRKIHQFLNIPYAEPPLGPLRFAPPVPLKAPKKILINSTKLGNHCIQDTIYVPKYQIDMSNNIAISEDCLVLNIWTPNVANSSDTERKWGLKPVMFSIYSGGFILGSIFKNVYNGSVLATNDVVFVSANYRVGPLGFLYSGDKTASGNAGLYDQLLALKWVRENIRHFGGDKNQITIFGYSSGSVSVSAHILSPLSKGLFKRAIMQSGSVMYNRDRPVLSAVEALKAAKQLAQRLNCGEFDNKWLDCLRAIEDTNHFIVWPNGSQLLWQHPMLVINIEVMTGVTKDEGNALSYLRIPEMNAKLTEQLFRKAVTDLSGEYHNIDVDKVCDHYLNGVHTTNSSQLKAALSALYGDLEFTCPTYHFAKSLATRCQRMATNVYFYRFNFQTKLTSLQRNCADGHVCHAAEVDLVYGQPLRYPSLYSKTEYNFSIDVMKIWTNFAKTGKAHEVWPQFWDKSVIRVKDLNPNDMSLILDNPYESTCDGIWNAENRCQQIRWPMVGQRGVVWSMAQQLARKNTATKILFFQMSGITVRRFHKLMVSLAQQLTSHKNLCVNTQTIDDLYQIAKCAGN